MLLLTPSNSPTHSLTHSHFRSHTHSLQLTHSHTHTLTLCKFFVPCLFPCLSFSFDVCLNANTCCVALRCRISLYDPQPPISRNTAGYEPDKQHVPALFEKVLTAIAHPDGLSPEGPCNAGAFRLSMCVCVYVSVSVSPSPSPPSLPSSLPSSHTLTLSLSLTHTHTLCPIACLGVAAVCAYMLCKGNEEAFMSAFGNVLDKLSVCLSPHTCTPRGVPCLPPPLTLRPSFSPRSPLISPSLLLFCLGLHCLWRRGEVVKGTVDSERDLACAHLQQSALDDAAKAALILSD